MQDRDRLEWVDVARGVGIIAVVAGHVWTTGALREAVYSFHMPLFFILSGYLSRPQPPLQFTLRQLSGQMRPYAAFLAVLVLADQIIETARGKVPIFHNWPQDILPILLGGTWLRGPFTIFWFVPCLTMSRILFNCLLVRWDDPLGRRWFHAAMACLVLAYCIGGVTRDSPLGLLTVPMAVVLLWAGAVWRRIKWGNWIWLPLVPLSLCGLAHLFPALNMKAADYGWPLLSLASAIATSLLLFRFSQLSAPVGAPLAALGRASLVIMYLHVAFIHYLTPYLGKMWLALIALFVPFLLWQVIRRCPPARRIFL